MIDLTGIKIDDLPALCFNNQVRWFPENNDGSRDLLWYVMHFGLGIGGEGGEVIEAVKKFHRLAESEMDEVAWEELDAKLEEEMADVLAYIFDMCAIRRIRPSDILAMSMMKCEARWARKSPNVPFPAEWTTEGRDDGPTVPIESVTENCTCGEYQLTGTRVDERNGILHRVDGPCQVIVIG